MWVYSDRLTQVGTSEVQSTAYDKRVATRTYNYSRIILDPGSESEFGRILWMLPKS